ncbi:MAG: cysteine hydrolase family protein [Thermodesulfovibrionales bacterium]
MRIIWISLTVALLAVFLTSSVTPLHAADKQEGTKIQTRDKLALDNARTAVLIMDYQNDIVGMLPANEQTPLLEKAGAILRAARQAGLPVIYVVVRFRDGFPEISPQNKLFAGLKESGRLREGTLGAEIHPKVAAQPGDIVVTKRRVGAFTSTDLETILRAKNIDTLVLFGIASSGVVLSTVRLAADMDYKLFVVSDACADMDKEVQRVLTEKVFPRQATVVTTEEFVKAIGRKAGIQEGRLTAQ